MVTACLPVRLLEGSPLPPGEYTLSLMVGRLPGPGDAYPVLLLTPAPDAPSGGLSVGPAGISQLSHTAGRMILVCCHPAGTGLANLTMALEPAHRDEADAVVRVLASYWAGTYEALLAEEAEQEEAESSAAALEDDGSGGRGGGGGGDDDAESAAPGAAGGRGGRGGAGAGGAYSYRYSSFKPKRAVETEELANYALRILMLASNCRSARGSMSRARFRAAKSVEIVNTLACDMAVLAGA
jgi:hypothetical protein